MRIIELGMPRDDQRERLQEWHEKAHLMHVAHSKAAAREARKSRGLGVAVAIFTAVTGTTMFATWEASPSPAVQGIVGVIAVAAVVMAAWNTAANYGKQSIEHLHAGIAYGQLRREMEGWRIEHPQDSVPDREIVHDWLKSWLDIEAAAPVVGDTELRRAEARLSSQHAQEPDPW